MELSLTLCVKENQVWIDVAGYSGTGNPASRTSKSQYV